MTAPHAPDDLWPAILVQTRVTTRSDNATVVRIDHRIPEPAVGANAAARWRIRTPGCAPILPSAFDPAVARSARTVAADRGRVLLLADIASARTVAVLTYHLDADPRRAVQLLALGATSAIPAPEALAHCWILKQYAHAIGVLTRRGEGHVVIDAPDQQHVLDLLGALGFSSAPRRLFGAHRASGVLLSQPPTPEQTVPPIPGRPRRRRRP